LRNARSQEDALPEQQESIYYEVMWRSRQQDRRMPLPWWVQQYFRHWIEDFDAGLFPSKEAAFCSNALYRYWNMVGVKNAHQECLVGQAGEVEPVYDEYSLSFFLFDDAARQVYFPQHPDFTAAQKPLRQAWQNNHLPILITRYAAALGLTVEQRVLATTVGIDQKSMGLVRFNVGCNGHTPVPAWFCIAVTPAGPTGFRRHDRARSFVDPRWLQFLRYIPAETRLEINQRLGPVFDKAPDLYGMYGNGTGPDPGLYLQFNPFADLASLGTLNGFDTATDYFGGFCQAVLAWKMNIVEAADTFTLDVRLPIDDNILDAGDLQVMRQPAADFLEENNLNYWRNLLDNNGVQMTLPPLVAHLFDFFRVCRSSLLILADDGEIHPGPTIYDSFWIRDSSVEGIACAIAGDFDIPTRQFGEHYTSANTFHMEQRRIGPVSLYGFFGGEHEINDQEWDSNGEALWAFGRFDRIQGANAAFGARLFTPYVVSGARWLRDNRASYGLLYSGWSAEHLGDKDKPHFWDNLWAVAGLWEAAQLAQRLNAPQTQELWDIYNDVARATAESIRWTLAQQQQRGFWETFIPTGPADVGRLDSTMIGTVAYFHPARLYMGQKLGADIDYAARQTLETIWVHFVDGGFRHDAAWRCYGPYLTLQLAHAFLYTGQLDRMDFLLEWVVNAGFAQMHDSSGGSHLWQVVQGAWNEQHNYPVAKDFGEIPPSWWYMGDIPHGWAAAEFILLLRDILFFEADEDHDPQIFLAPGVVPHWLAGDQTIKVENAPTIYGVPFGYELHHDESAHAVTISIRQPAPLPVRYIYPSRLGTGIASARADGQAAVVQDHHVLAPAGTRTIEVVYAT
jgi:hypothetical protein